MSRLNYISSYSNRYLISKFPSLKHIIAHNPSVRENQSANKQGPCVLNSYTVVMMTQVYVSETRKLNRDFPLSLGRGKNDDPYSYKSKNSQ